MSEIIHKKKNHTRFTACRLRFKTGTYPLKSYKILLKVSTFWKDVNCKECLDLLIVKKVTHVTTWKGSFRERE